MKKKCLIFLTSILLIFSVTFTAFAFGDTEINNGQADEYFSYEYSDGIFNNENSEDMFGKYTGVIIAISLIISFLSALFLPLVIIMIVFIVLNNKAAKRVRRYEMTYGIVYTNEVINDMKNIPLQNYNYNPATFVPQYPVNENQFNNAPQQQSGAFSQELLNQQMTQAENDGGNTL